MRCSVAARCNAALQRGVCCVATYRTMLRHGVRCCNAPSRVATLSAGQRGCHVRVVDELHPVPDVHARRVRDADRRAACARARVHGACAQCARAHANSVCAHTQAAFARAREFTGGVAANAVEVQRDQSAEGVPIYRRCDESHRCNTLTQSGCKRDHRRAGRSAGGRVRVAAEVLCADTYTYTQVHLHARYPGTSSTRRVLGAVTISVPMGHTRTYTGDSGLPRLHGHSSAPDRVDRVDPLGAGRHGRRLGEHAAEQEQDRREQPHDGLCAQGGQRTAASVRGTTGFGFALGFQAHGFIRVSEL